MYYAELYQKARTLVGNLVKGEDEESRMLIEELVDRFYGFYVRIEKQEEQYRELSREKMDIHKRLLRMVVREIKREYNADDLDIQEALESDDRY